MKLLFRPYLSAVNWSSSKVSHALNSVSNTTGKLYKNHRQVKLRTKQRPLFQPFKFYIVFIEIKHTIKSIYFFCFKKTLHYSRD